MDCLRYRRYCQKVATNTSHRICHQFVLQHLKYCFTLSGLTVPQTAAASGALAERTTSIVHPLAVNAEAQLAQTPHNQMTAVVKITMIPDFCVFTIHEE